MTIKLNKIIKFKIIIIYVEIKKNVGGINYPNNA